MPVLPEARNVSSQHGLFLFFVLGLFMLQVAFAFTIHGDIGPGAAFTPGIDRPASPALVGRIDSLLTATPPASRPLANAVGNVAPQVADAPAKTAPAKMVPTKTAPAATMAPAKAAHALPAGNELKSPVGGRYLEYTISRGDTLDSISRKLYGSTHMVTALVRLNRLTDDRGLRCGETLRVPRVGLMVASR